MSNMHLFNPKGKIKRYDTPEQILEELFHLRLQFYEKRKTALLLTLRSHLSKLENKVALMSGVLDSGVVDVNKLSTDLYIKAMSIITLVSRDSCPEMLQVLLADIDRINLKVKKLEGSTPRTLWLEELAALELELDKLEKQKFIGLHLPVLHWKQMKMDVAAVPRLQQQSELQKLLHMVEELNSK
uniref:DNA topoisomerase 2-like isoform X2 n=1 Tax=Fragaria vesca subsp. vesca TaxID=101020 RepID=UPI0005C96D23|nr:PREDICTED: DNA topoisomerase 2-like isoform X2 [Fragaria vesca subsp. vesca]